MSTEGPVPFDPKRIKAFKHKTRVEILEYLSSHRVASAPELAKALRIRQNRVSYHLDVLLECDCVKKTVTRKRNGRDVQFYAVKPDVIYPSPLPPLLGQEPITRDKLRTFSCKMKSVLEASAADDHAATTFALETLVLTEPAKLVAQETIRITLASLRTLHEQCRVLHIATDAPLAPVEFGVALFPAAPPDSEDEDGG